MNLQKQAQTDGVNNYSIITAVVVRVRALDKFASWVFKICLVKYLKLCAMS